LLATRNGDIGARDRLFSRYHSILKRWTHGRLPRFARDLPYTNDFVHFTLIRTLDKLRDFQPATEGAFLSYLRIILLNQIRDEIRRVRRRPKRSELLEDMTDGRASPLEQVLGIDLLERYECALGQLPAEESEAIVLRVEFGFTYPQLAGALGKPTADAARMFVVRALARLGEMLSET
jgi:RNA polymerase sigma-70 factor, ECF subfamily